MPAIDLHSHTLHSDGDRSPAQLFAEAAAAGLEVLAVTDHDTVAGIAECQVAADAVGVRLVPGIELSSELHGREVHILGHFLDPKAEGLLRLATGMIAERRERMERMIALAQGMGFTAVTLERVIACSGGENFGRPHLARVLVDCGHADSIQDAFARYLRTRGPLWVDRRRLSVVEAVELVHRSSGTASVAHPGANGISRQELIAMASTGLDAVEAFHPDHAPNQAEAYQRWAGELGLLVTAGSDYHGITVQPGRKLGDRSLSRERFFALEERARSRRG
ncbi:MAG: PHP domain-containing protein [Deltaproteobacteria bacterium]|nr:MAG: PHP domain-containing protein [Deltaproteobacteria bacterium]